MIAKLMLTTLAGAAMNPKDLSEELTCSAGTSSLPQDRCSLKPSEAGDEDAVALLRIISSSLSLLGSTAVILLVIGKRQLKNSKVHPIFALAVTDVLLSIMWIIGGTAWLRRLEKRVLCFAISVPTVILECITINLTLVYALHAYSGIKNKNPETLLLQAPDNDRPDKNWSVQRTLTAYFVAWTLPVVAVATIFTMIVLCSNYILVKNANDCSCWCLPTLGNVLPLAISVDNSTTKYVLYVYILETAYGAIVGTNYLLVFVLLIVVYSKSLIYIKQMRKQLESSEQLSVVQLIEKGQIKAKRTIFAFLTVFLINGFCNFILAYTLLVLEIHVFVSYGTHRITPDKYHNARKNSKFEALFALLFLQSLTVPLQGFLNAIVYAWTKEDFLKVMGISDTDGEIIDIFDNSLSEYDLEESVEENRTSRVLEGTATISIRSLPEDTSPRGRSYYAADDHDRSPDHRVYKTY